MENAVIGDHPGVPFGFHVCRGNQGSRWLPAGAYDPIARAIFRGIRPERLLLEYDDQRSGSFDALAEVPEDKTVVLGLVTTKSPRMETIEGLEARVRAAGRFVPLERLALSPQCGFSTSAIGNRLSTEDQRRKLEVAVRATPASWAARRPDRGTLPGR